MPNQQNSTIANKDAAPGTPDIGSGLDLKDGIFDPADVRELKNKIAGLDPAIKSNYLDGDLTFEDHDQPAGSSVESEPTKNRRIEKSVELYKIKYGQLNDIDMKTLGRDVATTRRVAQLRTELIDLRADIILAFKSMIDTDAPSTELQAIINQTTGMPLSDTLTEYMNENIGNRRVVDHVGNKIREGGLQKKQTVEAGVGPVSLPESNDEGTDLDDNFTITSESPAQSFVEPETQPVMEPAHSDITQPTEAEVAPTKTTATPTEDSIDESNTATKTIESVVTEPMHVEAPTVGVKVNDWFTAQAGRGTPTSDRFANKGPGNQPENGSN